VKSPDTESSSEVKMETRPDGTEDDGSATIPLLQLIQQLLRYHRSLKGLKMLYPKCFICIQFFDKLISRSNSFTEVSLLRPPFFSSHLLMSMSILY